MLAAAAALVLAAAAAAAEASTPPSGRDPAAGFAGIAVVDACMLRLDAATSAAEYAAGSTEVGRLLKAQIPGAADLPVQVAGVDGRGCRVTYRGPFAADLWKTFAEPAAAPPEPGCAVRAAKPDVREVACPATHDNVAYARRVERTGDQVTVTLDWLGPRTP